MVISRRWLLRALVVIRVLGGANGLANGRFQFSQAIYSTTEDFGVAYITVQRSLGFDGRAAVYVSTIPGAGNAVPGRDFRPLFNDSLVWQDGEDFEKALYVPIYNDGKPQETVKDFTLRLHDADGAEINLERSQTQIVLVPPSNLFPGSFSFETSTVSVAEDNTLSIPVLWMAGTTSTANVQFEFVCQSACLPGDFTLISPKPQLLTWKRDDYPSTSTARKQNIVLSVPDDGLYEQSETFLVRLVLVEPVEGDAVSTGTIGEIGEIIVTIAGPNDVRPGTLQFESDCFPDCACNNYSIIAGGTARVIIQRRRGDNGAVSVSVASQDGTAFAGVDYVSMQQTLSWDDGDTSDRQILVTSLARADPRLPSRRIALVLRNNQGAPLGGIYASTAYVDITTPTDVFVGDVNFATREPLDSVLRFPDLSFIPLATRNTSSRLQLCPRIVTTKVGVLSIAIQRNFNDFPVPASVRVNTIDGTATAGVDFEPLTNAIVSWANSDSEVKNVNVKLLTPPTYDPHPRSFQLHLTDARGAIVGECNVLDVELTGIAQGAHVVSFDLDMAIGTLTLRMSLPVQASTLDITNLLLQSERELKNGPTFAFSSQSTTTNSGDGTIIVLNIGASDLNALKQTFGLAKTTASTFLSVGIGLFRYVLNKCESTGIHACPAGITEVIPKDAALTVGTFTADTIPPTLLSYSFDLSRRLLKLRFSESVNFAKLNIEALTLAETTAGFDVYQLSSATTRLFAPQPDPLSGATLTDTNRLPPDYTFLTLQLGSADTAALANFGSGQIGIKRANTFLGIDSTFIADFATNPVRAIGPGSLLQVSPTNCSPCPAGSYLTSSCSDSKDRTCSPCSVCPENSFALETCKPTQDTLCYPCTECHGGQFASVACTPSTDRVCSPCTQCTLDEFEVSPCAAGVDRVCRTCDSCVLTSAQQLLCQRSPLWKRLQMRSPFSCPAPDQRFKTREEQLQRAQSNRCGSGRCACVATGIPGNSNPNGDGFPYDERCTGHVVYNILI